MSGLEKFEASEAWRSNLKKFLPLERKAEIVQSSTRTTSQRYSLDISEDLKSVIEVKKRQKTAQVSSEEEVAKTFKMSSQVNEKSNAEGEKHPNEEKQKENYEEFSFGHDTMWQRKSFESFETLEKMCEKTISDPNSTLFKYLNGEQEQNRNNVVVWQKNSDESFEALERMCDKTASDPNSTLFKYLHTDHKEEILAEIKKRSTDGQNPTARNAEDQLLSKINNCTLLDDVEAPSRLWENTICGDGGLQTSPVKMVGLLRPSTIIEEAPDDSANSDVSSHFSFHTAAKSGQSDVSTSAYETAHDSTAASNKSKSDRSNKFRSEGPKQINVDHQDLLVNVEQTATEMSPAFDILENTIVEPATLSKSSEAGSNSNGIDESIDLIDLEKTFAPAHGYRQASLSEAVEPEFENKSDPNNVSDDDSVIEIISDGEDDVDEGTANRDVVCNANIKSETSANATGITNESYSLDDTEEDDKENSIEQQKSMQFNDTMEEVEYLLKKGMEYMAAAAANEKSPTKMNAASAQSSDIKETKSQPISPLKLFKSVKPASCHSASKVKPSTYCTPTTKALPAKSSASASKRFDMDIIKPFPKFDIFAKPLPQNRPKELASKQQKFSHIISPIGTYMKKTAQTPLMSSINCKTKDYFNSTAIMELENESRLYKPQFQMVSNDPGKVQGLPKLPGLINEAKRPLPKKAYISSDLKHIVDERTPITIPASKKIQKYLENAMMPAVLRHEGKFKVPGGISNKFNTSSGTPSKLPLKESDTNSVHARIPAVSQIPRRNNASLADLSLMSGDVSMYTIMDAQKF